ncbi:MAG: DUF3786 domain-containing protein [Nitrospirae bacterium]|nr:DUF3786 domain-containing protein [Nitrospirota bacterium]
MAEIISGEDKAWEIIAGLLPEDVCMRTGAQYNDRSKLYTLPSFGTLFSLDPQKKIIMNLEPAGEIFLTRLRYFFVLSLLWYLVKASDAIPGGKLIKPSGMTGGDIFFRGSHVLPLDSIAKKYAHDRRGFRERGLSHGGKVVEYGDVAIELSPFSKVPVTVILWLADDEWEARADILFDSTAQNQLPIDLLWSVAMMSVLIFL